MAALAEQPGNTQYKGGASVTKRLQKELMTLMMEAVPGASAFPDSDSIFTWVGTIKGTEGTVYDGLEYKLSLKFPADYPMSAPTIKFTTPIFHPNVDTHGNICLDILKEKWSAAYSVKTILLSIQSLLGEPNCDSPLNTHAAQLWADQEKYRSVLKEKYAMRSADECCTIYAASALPRAAGMKRDDAILKFRSPAFLWHSRRCGQIPVNITHTAQPLTEDQPGST